MLNDVLKLLRQLKKANKITVQQFRTYRGQALSGDIEGCLRGLKRNNLI